MSNHWRIGEQVIDEDGHVGRVCIVWNDGDICTIENDAAHPNPKWKELEERIITCPVCILSCRRWADFTCC